MPLQYTYMDPQLFAKVANLKLIARLVVEGVIAGLHKSPYHGFSVEFSEYRKYCPGDDLKNLDWKVFAKCDRFYIKTFEEETNLKCYLVLDTSGSMGFGGERRLTKFQYSCYSAAAMAYLMIRQQDAVGLAAFDRTIHTYLVPKSSPQHLRDILATLEHMKASTETNIAGAFHELAERIKRRGLILVFSDLLDDPEGMIKGLAHFRHKKHEVVVFHILDDSEIDFPYDELIDFEDLETGRRLQVHARLLREQVRAKVGDFLRDVQGRCTEHAIDYIRLRTSTPIHLALVNYLSKRSRLG
ncbi:MAG: DUF58 domain-containing protein [Candidatus Sumerlaeia bacterium]|nr:DUF58 domain-containing protein [Candidatus Sumerlaeia bacterium]